MTTLDEIKATPLLDAEAIAESKELMGDKFGKLVGYFLEDSAMYIGQVEQAFARGDAEGLVPPAHTLKSSSRQMGCARLALLAEAVEHGGRDLVKQNGHVSALASFIPVLRATLDATVDAYHEVTPPGA